MEEPQEGWQEGGPGGLDLPRFCPERVALQGDQNLPCQEEAVTMDTDVAKMLGKRALPPQDSPFSQENCTEEGEVAALRLMARSQVSGNLC